MQIELLGAETQGVSVVVVLLVLCIIWARDSKRWVDGYHTSLLLVHLLTNGILRVSYQANCRILLLRVCFCRSGPHGRGF
jgi:hypothetical protein